MKAHKRERGWSGGGELVLSFLLPPSTWVSSTFEVWSESEESGGSVITAYAWLGRPSHSLPQGRTSTPNQSSQEASNCVQPNIGLVVLEE